MLKKPTQIESVPFFWTVLLGKSIRYTGKGFSKKNVMFTFQYLLEGCIQSSLRVHFRRVRGRLHRRHTQRQSGGKEVPSILY